MSKQLKIGVIIQDDTIPLWFSQSIETWAPYATIETIQQLQTSTPQPRSIALSCILQWYRTLDRKVFGNNKDAFSPIKIDKGLNTDVSLDAYDRDILLAKKLDILIYIGQGAPPDELISIARQGLWFFAYGRPETPNSQLGLEECLKNSSTTRISLLSIQNESESITLLGQTLSSTHPYSLYLTQQRAMWAGTDLLDQSIRKVSQLGETFFETQAKKIKTPSLNILKVNNIGLFESLTLIVKITLRLIIKIWDKLFFQTKWVLLFGKIEKQSTGITFEPEKLSILHPPKETFWADPFPIEHDGKLYIFLEEYLYHKKKGILSVMHQETNREFSQPTHILEKGYHLSYPFIFKDKDTYYMIPETSQNHTIDLYKCTRFPDQWDYERTLLSGISAVDTTVIFHHNKWWLFTAISPYKGAEKGNNLHLFYADDFKTSEWTPHPLNPISSDICNARPGGHIIQEDTRLIRVSQDGSKSYGYGLNFHAMTFSETTYEETSIRTIHPNWNPKIVATHTFNKTSDVILSDARYRSRRF